MIYYLGLWSIELLKKNKRCVLQIKSFFFAFTYMILLLILGHWFMSRKTDTSTLILFFMFYLSIFVKKKRKKTKEEKSCLNRTVSCTPPLQTMVKTENKMGIASRLVNKTILINLFFRMLVKFLIFAILVNHWGPFFNFLILTILYNKWFF